MGEKENGFTALPAVSIERKRKGRKEVGENARNGRSGGSLQFEALRLSILLPPLWRSRDRERERQNCPPCGSGGVLDYLEGKKARR